MDKLFDQQVAIITGAGSGLGQAIAKRLSQLGARLALFDKNSSALELVRKEIGGNIIGFAVDIKSEDEVRRAVESTVSHFNTVDVLINSAGITGKTNVQSHEVEDANLRNVFDVNFMGSFYTSRYVLPIMLKNNYGRILHIASIAGKEGNAGMLAYSASKAAVIAMTKVQGKEYATTNITVNALAPAVIETAMVHAMPKEQVTYMTDKIPMKRCGTLDEVAEIVSFIVSRSNSFTTGFTYDLSGGRATY